MAVRSVGEGRYTLGERLGEGGMGVVWSARDEKMRRPVAVKLLHPEDADRAETRNRFLREWHSVGRLAHENVVRAYDCGWDEGGMYLVMERLDGTSLRRRMQQAAPGRLTLAQVIDWGGQICDALDAAHEAGLVHRDLKPANVQITGRDRAVLLDFGIACFQEDEYGNTRITPAGFVVGTREYMSPEQTRGGDVGPASDLYSFGCLLYAMLTGRPPFLEGDLVSQHRFGVPVEPRVRRSDVPRRLNDLVMDLLEKHPQQRPADAGTSRRLLADSLSSAPRAEEARSAPREPAPEGGTDGTPGAPNAATIAAEQELRADAPPVRDARPPVPLPDWRVGGRVGTGLLGGLGTFGLLLGAGGAGVGVAAFWGGCAALLAFVSGLSVALTAPSEEGAGIAMGCLGLPAALAAVVGGVWLVAARGGFPWYYDFLIGLGLAVGLLALAFVAFVAWSFTGVQGTDAMLVSIGFGTLGVALFAVHLHFAWWTAVLTGVGLWAVGVVLTALVHTAAGES
ncbi:protein kinase [Streptomyces sp. NPDC008150]|uniref:serine/threonine-protein kinase n=1 Tax=Streptomyces sp. NPDC008150 TaxID=3364816 RepID=UPI0036F0A366